MKTVFIIHGWGGSPNESMHKWLKSELEQKGFEVIAPTMPDPETPRIDAWVGKLKEIINQPNEDTILIGHSIGCQTILRYLEQLPQETRIGSVVFIAPWLKLQNLKEAEFPIAGPWLNTPINDANIVQHVPKMVAIFSDNDPVVPMENKSLFEKRFNAKTIVEHKKGHFTEEDDVALLPSALNVIANF